MAALFVWDVKTTLPLLSSVRTSRNPRPSTSARRSAIATRFVAPTLFTPRSSATCLCIGRMETKWFLTPFSSPQATLPNGAWEARRKVFRKAGRSGR
jgi:hypothetical protein